MNAANTMTEWTVDVHVHSQRKSHSSLYIHSVTHEAVSVLLDAKFNCDVQEMQIKLNWKALTPNQRNWDGTETSHNDKSDP